MYRIFGTGALEGLEEKVERPLSEVRVFEMALPNGEIAVVTFSPKGINISVPYPKQILLFLEGSLVSITEVDT